MAKENIAAEKAATYSKEQILQSAKYATRRDLLTAILEENRAYTIDEVEARIEKFMKGKVN